LDEKKRREEGVAPSPYLFFTHESFRGKEKEGIKDDNHSSVLTTIMNPSVDDRLKREEKIEKIGTKQQP